MLRVVLNKQNSPYVFTVVASLLLSFLAVSTDNLINHDAVHFMDAAKIFLRDGALASFSTYAWPFYSWFIAIAHQYMWFTHVEQTAHFINALLLVATCVLFIQIYSEVTDQEGSLWVAAILVLTLVGINRYRADIMRDIAYWCFYLSGFLCLLKYYRQPSWKTAIGWQIFMILAFLARSEAIVLIALGPLALLLKDVQFKQRILQAAALYGIYIAGLCVVVFLYLFMDSALHVPANKFFAKLGNINIDVMAESFDKAVRKLGEIYWYEGSKDKYYGFLSMVYIFTLLSYVSLRIIECFSLPFFLVLGFGIYKKRLQLTESNKIVLYFISFLFVFFVIYMIRGPVLSARYTTSLVFMLLIFLGQVVERLRPDLFAHKHKKKILVVGFAYLFLTTADSVISSQGDSKTYVLESGYWMKDNVGLTVPVYSNYYKALYYADSGRSFKRSMEFETLIKRVKKGTLGKKAYLMVQIKQKQEDEYSKALGKLVEDEKIEYVIEFDNSEDERIVIYKLGSPNN